MICLPLLCFTALAVGVLSADKVTPGDVHTQMLDLRLIGLPFPIVENEASQKLELLREVLQSATIEGDSLIGTLTEILMAANDTGNCFTDVTYIGSLLSTNKSADKPLKAIAEQYADAMTKIPYGIYQGKWMWEGDYQQCKKIDRITSPHTNSSFEGVYMTSKLFSNGKPFLTYANTLCIGVCLPDSCSEDEASTVISIGLDYVVKVLKLQHLNISVAGTYSSAMPSLDTGAVVTLTVVCIVTLLVAIGTLLDYYFSKSEVRALNLSNINASGDMDERSHLLPREPVSENINRKERISETVAHSFKAFSLRSNSVKLFGTKTADGPLACLNGLRVLSMWWVILGHTFGFVSGVADNPASGVDFIKRFSFQPIMNGTFSVDSFFFLSGLLVAYLAIKEISEKGKLNWVYFFVHRYWRLTPLLAFVILVYRNLFPYILFGPFRFLFSSFEGTEDGCETYWWSNLLYINNFYPYYGSLSDTCIGWTWYLANDMQFYIFISPIVILTLTRKKTLGLLTIVFLIVSCVLIRGAIVLYYGIYGLTGPATKHVDEPMGHNGPLYGRPYARHSVYVIGMLTGYVLAAKRNRIRMYRSVALLGWIVAIATGLSVIYGQYYYNHHADEVPAPHMTLAGSVFYVSLCRTAWGFCLAWVVLACVAGKGGLVKDILSWKIWAPLGRLTYAAYLVHPITIYFYYVNQERPIHLSDLSMVYMFIGNIVVAYGVAFIVSMGIEAPMIQLERLIIKALRSRRDSTDCTCYNFIDPVLCIFCLTETILN